MCPLLHLHYSSATPYCSYPDAAVNPKKNEHSGSAQILTLDKCVGLTTGAIDNSNKFALISWTRHSGTPTIQIFYFLCSMLYLFISERCCLRIRHLCWRGCCSSRSEWAAFEKIHLLLFALVPLDAYLRSSYDLFMWFLFSQLQMPTPVFFYLAFQFLLGTYFWWSLLLLG